MTVKTLTERVLSRREFIGLVAALMALNSLAIDVMLPALPYMGAALGVTNENERQLVIAAYMLGFGIAQLAFGPLSDRFGRRNPLLIGIVIYVAAAFLAVYEQPEMDATRLEELEAFVARRVAEGGVATDF